VPFDFERPSASPKVDGTWPVIELYGPVYTATWKSLYDKSKLDFQSSLICRNRMNIGSDTCISMPGISTMYSPKFLANGF